MVRPPHLPRRLPIVRVLQVAEESRDGESKASCGGLSLASQLQGRRCGHVRLRSWDDVVHVLKLHENEVGVGVGLVGSGSNRSGDELGDELEDAALGVPMGLNYVGAICSKGPLRCATQSAMPSHFFAVWKHGTRLFQPFRRSSQDHHPAVRRRTS